MKFGPSKEFTALSAATAIERVGEMVKVTFQEQNLSTIEVQMARAEWSRLAAGISAIGASATIKVAPNRDARK